MRILLTILLILSFSNALSADDAQSAIRIDATDSGYRIVDGSRTVLFFQAVAKSEAGKFERAVYVHPLFDLDGNVLTEDFPADHKHHRGIFWAWHQLEVNGTRAGDPWICKDFLAKVQGVESLLGDKRAALRVTSHWQSPQWIDKDGKSKPIVKEVTTIRASSETGNARAIDFEISLLAMEKDVRIGGSEDAKGYGGFSPRIRLPDGLVFLAKYGEVTPQRLSVDPSPWMDMTGRFSDGDDLSGVTIIGHPSLPGFPQRWILRQKRSMQNPVFPGNESVRLPTDKPLVLRYRMVLHRDRVTAEQIDEWNDDYLRDVPADRAKSSE